MEHRRKWACSRQHYEQAQQDQHRANDQPEIVRRRPNIKEPRQTRAKRNTQPDHDRPRPLHALETSSMTQLIQAPEF